MLDLAHAWPSNACSGACWRLPRDVELLDVAVREKMVGGLSLRARLERQLTGDLVAGMVTRPGLVTLRTPVTIPACLLLGQLGQSTSEDLPDCLSRRPVQ